MRASAKPSRRRSHNTPAARRVGQVTVRDAMETFAALFPELLAEFMAELEVAGNAYLANQLRLSAVRSVSYDADSDAAVIALESPRQLNPVQRRVMGVRYEQSVPVSKTYGAHIELDN